MCPIDLRDAMCVSLPRPTDGSSDGLVGTEARHAWAENMAKQQNVTKEEFLSGFCKRMGILAGRWADMDEIADTAVFLASDRARYINGSRIVVDGGMTINPRPA